jgi:hypothetical protein
LTEKQFDVLTGLSRNMEKSLGSIEKSLGASSKAGEKGNNALSGLAQSLGSLVSSLSSKKFDAKKANTILDFSKGLVTISNSVNPKAAKAFSDFATGISGTFDTLLEVLSPIKLLKLHLATKILFEGKNPMLKRIAVGMSNAFDGLDPKKAKAGSEAIKNLGEGLLSLTAALKSFILIGIAAPLVLIGALVVRAVIGLFTSFGKNAKQIEEGGKALKELGKGLMLFSAGLASLILVTMIAGPAVAAGIGLIALFGVTFYLLGKAEKSIKDGAQAVALMALAMFGFSMALASFMLVMMIATPTLVLAGMLVIAGFGVMFALLGLVKKHIIEGAEAMLGMAIGLFFFSLALMVFGLAIKMYTPKDLLMGALLITEFGLAMFILGKFEKQITQGAFVMADMGVALGLFGIGLIFFGIALKLFEFKDILLGAGLITGLGIAVSIVGSLPNVTSGAIALAEVGAALITVGAGILVFGIAIKLLQAIFKGDLANAGLIAGGILIGLGLAFAAIGLVASTIAPGAGAMIAVGIALVAISVGILIFALAIKALVALFKGDLEGAGKMAGGILLGLGLAFAALGLLAVPILLGSVGVLTMGVSLVAFSLGLFTFGASLAFLDSKGLLVKDGDGYTLKGASILWNLSKIIAGIGIQALNPFFWLGMATAVGLGTTLLVIGTGLFVAAEALDKVKNMDKLIEGIFGDSGLIPKMAESFSKIGKKYGGGLLSSFLGMDDVSVGVRVAGGFGEVLKDIAGGIVAFADFTQFPVKVPNPKDPSNLIYKTVDIFGSIIPALNENLPILLGTLASTFADIGNKYGGDSGWFGEDSPVQKGINAVKGIGGVLSELAGGIIAFANFTEFPVQVPDPKDPSKLIYKVVDLMSTLPTIQTALIGDGVVGSSNKGILFGLANVFATIGDKYGEGFFTKGSTKKGVEAVQGIGGVLSELASGIVAFATFEKMPNYDKDGKFNGTYTPYKFGDVKDNIIRVLTTLPEVFSTIDLDTFASAQEKADAAKPLAESISKIGAALNSLMVDKGKGEKVNIAAMIGPVLKQFIEDTNGINIDDSKTQQLVSLGNALSKFAGIGGGLSEFAKALSSTGKAFESFSKGFTTFSSQLDRFIRFENSFSNLVKNQKQYNFGEFAKSMGVLKTNVNDFNVENLKLTDSLMKSLAILSKSPDSLGETIKASLEESMKLLIEAIQKLTETQKASNSFESSMGSNPVTSGTVADGAKSSGVAKAPAATTAAKPAATAAGNTPNAQAAALADLKSSIDRLAQQFSFDSKVLKVRLS